MAALERIEIKETIDKQIDHGVDVEKLIENQYNNNDLLAAAQFGTALAAFNAHKAEHDEAINMYWLNKEETLKFSDVRELDDEDVWTEWSTKAKAHVEAMDIFSEASRIAGLVETFSRDNPVVIRTAEQQQTQQQAGQVAPRLMNNPQRQVGFGFSNGRLRIQR